MPQADKAALAAAVTPGKGGIYIAVHAQPGARRPQLRGMHGDAIKLAISQAAQDGKANTAIVNTIAEAMGVAKGDVAITSGQSSRQKRVFVQGDAERLKARLAEWLAESGR